MCAVLSFADELINWLLTLFVCIYLTGTDSEWFADVRVNVPFLQKLANT